MVSSKSAAEHTTPIFFPTAIRSRSSQRKFRTYSGTLKPVKHKTGGLYSQQCHKTYIIHHCSHMIERRNEQVNERGMVFEGNGL